MASSNRKTTMNKLNRERKLRERRIDKQVRKDIRKRAAEDGSESGDGRNEVDHAQDEFAHLDRPSADSALLDGATESPADA